MDLKPDQAQQAKGMATEGWPGEIPLMPDLVQPQFGFYHTADSALGTLSRVGITPERITIKKLGRGWQKARVVMQQPSAGSSVPSDARVELSVEGDGLFYYLPTGMRVGAKEGEIGVAEIVSLFDDVVEKAGFYVRQGGLYFDLRPENRIGCARWIRLFGVAPEDWPVDSWYNLALLLPCLHYLAASEKGLRLALKVLLELEVEAINWRPRQTAIERDELSRFGERASCLGTSLILGDRLEDESKMEITVGPVSLPTFLKHQSNDGARGIEQVLHLLLPYHLDYSVRWLVGDVNSAPRLGNDQANSVLGVNTHLGRQMA